MTRAIFDTAEAAWGPVSILTNNASALVPDTFLVTDTCRMGRGLTHVSAATIDHNFAVDARVTALLIAEFASCFAGDSGRITANCVHPPPTDTGWISEGTRAAIEADGLRIALPNEVADVVAWLCSHQASGVSGNVIQTR